MFRHAWILVPLFVGAQEPLTIKDEVEALIEKTAALQSFHALYTLEQLSDDGEPPKPTTIELIYRAPEFGRVRAARDARGVEYITDERSMYVWSHVDDRESGWQRADWPAIPLAVAAFAQSFNSKRIQAQPGPAFDLTSNNGHDLSIGVGRQLRLTPLRWLQTLSTDVEGVSIDGNSFVVKTDDELRRISRANGFLEEAETIQAGKRLSLRLRELHTDEALDLDLATIPDEARGAAVDPRLAGQLEHGYEPGAVRQALFVAVERWITSGEHEWNDGAHASWKEVLDALHRQRLESAATTWREHSEQILDKVSDTVRSKHGSGASSAELDQWIAKARQDLERQLNANKDKYVRELPAIRGDKASPRPELFDVERDVIADLWDELVREPGLARFDEVTRAALAR